MINENDIVFKTIISCRRNRKKPDFHSFTVNINDGVAFVRADSDGEIVVKTDKGDKRHEYKGTAVAMAELLEKIGAEPKTISI